MIDEKNFFAQRLQNQGERYFRTERVGVRIDMRRQQKRLILRTLEDRLDLPEVALGCGRELHRISPLGFRRS